MMFVCCDILTKLNIIRENLHLSPSGYDVNNLFGIIFYTSFPRNFSRSNVFCFLKNVAASFLFKLIVILFMAIISERKEPDSSDIADVLLNNQEKECTKSNQKTQQTTATTKR